MNENVPTGSQVVCEVVNNVAMMVSQQIAKNKAQAKATMKWLPFMSTFVLKHMTTLIRTGVRTYKGFKEGASESLC